MPTPTPGRVSPQFSRRVRGDGARQWARPSSLPSFRFMPVHLADLRSLAHLVVALATLFAALSGAPPGDTWLWGPIAIFVGIHLLAVQHNHSHVPIFRGKGQNLLIDLTTGLVTGFPLAAWRLHHLRGHHPRPFQPGDPSSPYGLGSPKGHGRETSLWRYQLAYAPLFLAWSVDHAFRTGRARHRIELGLHTALVLVVSLVSIALWGALRFAAVWPTLWIGSGLCLGAINYYQHWQTQTLNGTHAGWTFTCRVHNGLNYGVGYHELHHRRPSLHWSQLRRVHEADPSYAPSDLIEHGLFPGYRLPWIAKRWRHQHGRAPAKLPPEQASGELCPVATAWDTGPLWTGPKIRS